MGHGVFLNKKCFFCCFNQNFLVKNNDDVQKNKTKMINRIENGTKKNIQDLTLMSHRKAPFRN